MQKKDVEMFIFSIIGGTFVAFATVVNLLCDNKYYGSFLFAFALVNIISFKLDLITGVFSKITIIEDKVKTSAIIFIGNFIGTFIVGASYRYVHTYKNIAEKINNSLVVKTGQNGVSLFIMSILCGIFIGIAVWVQKTDINELAKLYTTIISVIFFILIGAEHCVANMSLVHLAGDYSGTNMLFLLQNTIGNLAGGILVSAAGNYVISKRHTPTVQV